MESIIKKLFVATSIVVGASIGLAPVASFAAVPTPCDSWPSGAAGTCSDTVKDGDGSPKNTQVAVTILPTLVINAYTKNNIVEASPFMVKESNFSIFITANQAYQLLIRAENPYMTLVDENGTLDTTKTIPAGIPTAGQSSWAVRPITANGTNGDFMAVTTENQLLYTNEKPAVDDFDQITVNFGVSVSPTQASGTYKTNVTLTATTATSTSTASETATNEDEAVDTGTGASQEDSNDNNNA